MDIARGLIVPLYAQVDVLAITIIACLAILFEIYRKRSGNKFQLHMKAVVSFYIAYLISDILYQIVGSIDGVSVLIKYCLNAAYFSFLALAAYFWFVNVCKEIGFGNFKQGSSFWLISKVPVIIVVILSLSAFQNGLMFRENTADGYSRGPWFAVFIVVHYGYIIFASLIALNSYMARRHHTKIYNALILVIYCIPIILTGVLQLFFSGNYQAVGYATSLCILFVCKILNESFSMINLLKSVTSEYSCIYLCDPSYKSITPYRVDNGFFDNAESFPAFYDSHSRVHYEQFLEIFLNRYVSNVNRNELAFLLQMNSITKRLETEEEFSHMYISNKDHYCELDFRAMAGEQSGFILAIADKDEDIRKERITRQKLIEANRLANTDALTGFRNVLAYNKQIEELDRRIANGTAGRFAMAEFDLNYLKSVNDVVGHDIGDMYIKNTTMLLASIFKSSAVYRTGGDEFVAIIKGQDYENRVVLMEQVRSQSTAPREALSVLGTAPTVAAGLATFREGEDKSCSELFRRADADMYKYKTLMKQEQLGDLDN